jgi:hypothetical protein
MYRSAAELALDVRLEVPRREVGATLRSPVRGTPKVLSQSSGSFVVDEQRTIHAFPADPRRWELGEGAGQ